MATSYQDLEGSRGAGIFYRAARFRPRALFEEDQSTIRLGSFEARLSDISMTGAAFYFEDVDRMPALGTELPVELWVAGALTFSGHGQVTRTETATGKVAVRFVDALFDEFHARRVAEDMRLKQAIDMGIRRHEAVPERYARAILDVVLFLSHWKSLLGKRDRSLVRYGRTTSSEMPEDLEQLAERRMREEWRNVRARAIEAMPGPQSPPSLLRASKEYTQSLVTPLLMEGPIWNRAYSKPLGYPGDYLLMNYMYDEDRLGSTSYGRILHQLGREERLAATVAARKAFLVRLISETIDRVARMGRAIRITNLGAGPAREVEQFLSCPLLPRVPMTFTLIDQDEGALRFAQERLMRAALAQDRKRVTVRCRHVSFKEILSNRGLLADLADQDLVYSAGFFDYLPDRTAAELLRALFALLRPDGALVVGNAARDQDAWWAPEFVLDWHMVYRTEMELRNLAEFPLEGVVLGVESDPSKAWNFLKVHRSG